MNPNHSIDVEAERKLFEAEMTRQYGIHVFKRDALGESDNMAWQDAFDGWLAAKRSIPANTGTIDTPGFRQLLRDFVSESINEPDTSEADDRGALIAHIDARLNAERQAMIAVADAERLRIAEEYERRLANDTIEMGGIVNRQWAHLEGAVKVVKALRHAAPEVSTSPVPLASGNTNNDVEAK